LHWLAHIDWGSTFFQKGDKASNAQPSEIPVPSDTIWCITPALLHWYWN
jgi:hypothetical protein